MMLVSSASPLPFSVMLRCTMFAKLIYNNFTKLIKKNNYFYIFFFNSVYILYILGTAESQS